MKPNTNFIQKMEQLSEQYAQTCLPHISLDTVIFGFNGNDLNVLLLQMQYNSEWFLPGGYINKDEALVDAAKRVLYERTGVQNVFLEEFAVFGQLNRSESAYSMFPHDFWMGQRFITIGFYALINHSDAIPHCDHLSSDCRWHPLSSIHELNMTMDHRAILQKALLTLRRDLSLRPIGYQLLPDKFSLPELQRLYELILGKQLNRGNFYRKIKKLNILTKLNEQKTGGFHRHADLYEFNLEVYRQFLRDGLNTW